MSLKPLRRRCATSFLSCDSFTGSHFSRDVHNVSVVEPFHVRLDPYAPPTEADDSSIEAKGQEPQLLVPACADAHMALLSRGSLDDPDPLKPTRTARTSTKRFERPNYYHVFAHAVCCCVAYPIIYAGTVAAKDKSLFWARLIVGLWCAGIGVLIGWSLVAFATKYAEAASKHISRFFFCTPCPTPCLLIFAKHGQL